MTLYRYALTAIALAICHLAVAQSPGAQPARAADGAVQPGMPGGTAEFAVDGAATATPRTPTTAPETKGTEPRTIRGNDRVVAPAKPAPRFEGAPIAFNFEEAPVADVVRTILGDLVKVDYVLHPPLSGTITLTTRAPVAPDHAMFLLESALQANGLALLRDARGSYHVGRPEVLRSIGSVVRQAGSEPLPAGYGVILVPLQYIGAAEMAAILRPMMPADALVRVDTVRNLLVLVGTRSQAEGWMDLVTTFDVDLLKGMSVGIFPLKYATIKEVEAALQLMGGGGGASAAGAAQASIPGRPTQPAPNANQATAMLSESNPLFGAVRIMPIERLNSILVVTPRAAYLDEARRWIERLDQPSDNNAESQLFIYRVQNGNAKHLAGVLTGIFGDGKPATATGNATSGVAPGLTSTTTSSTPFGASPFGNTSNASSGTGGLGLRPSGLASTTSRTGGTTSAAAASAPVAATLGGVRVMADEINNVVLVWGSRTDYAKIETALKRLDIPPTQVLIEASIVEVTLTNDLQYGLQWAFSDSRSSSSYTGQGMLTNATDGGVLGGALRGFSYTLKNSAGSIRAVLNALASKTSIKVVASPSLMVLDNHTAAIAVGNQQPIKAGETVSAEGTVRSTNIQYKDTGVALTVTPSVNSGNIVTMQVDQSVTDVGAQDDVTGQRAFLQRQVSSKVAVRSGESIVMGGLIQEKASTGRGGVPILQDVPVLGSLFSTTTNNGNRTELIVIITPRVVRSDIDIREVSEDLRDRMKGLVRIKEKEAEPPSPLSTVPVPKPTVPN
jgi:general secretion pathway protein D